MPALPTLDTPPSAIVLQAIYHVGKYASRHIKATKCALSLLGICQDRLADPFDSFLPPERERVAEVLRSMGAIAS